jgi:CO/xanthine dehydrogenase FAD-binding subunit
MTVVVARSLDEVFAALGAHPGAMVLAGGTDAMVEINDGGRRPVAVIALDRVAELRTWSHDPATGIVRLGAAVTYREIGEPPISEWLPALAQAARTVGSPQIRQAATIGGNTATASPAGDGLPVLVALDATVHLVRAGASRDLPVGEFFTGPKRTVLAAGEVIESISLPAATGWQGFAKVGVRNAMVIATVSACLAVQRSTVRLALGSVAPTVIRCPEAERFATDALSAGSVGAAEIDRFADLARAAARPIDDHRSSAAYRAHAVGVLAGRLLRRAADG